MKFGNLDLKSCKDCPATYWRGENRASVDLGHACGFGGSLNNDHWQIPPNCPIRMMRDILKMSQELSEVADTHKMISAVVNKMKTKQSEMSDLTNTMCDLLNYHSQKKETT